MPQIVISEFMDQASVDAVSPHYDVVYDPDLVDRPEELKALLRDARALVVRNRTQVDQELLKAGPNLKVIGRLGVGLDNIDLEACRARGVQVCPATGANDAAVAEWVVTTALMLLRSAFLSNTQMIAGQWPRNQLMGREIAGKTLGLVGYGRIARETARMANALGMKVIAYDPYVSADDPCWQDTTRLEKLESLLASSDVVSLHVPLTEHTRHLMNARTMAQMKKDAVLINAARGGVVDEAALVDALKNGRLGGAALDVFETEPLSEAAARPFADIPNIVLTPHIAGVTQESNQRVSRLTMENVRRVLEDA